MGYKSELQSNNIDLQSILDMILALGLVDAPPPIINFTISGYGDYQAEEGMTWGEWCNSKYSVDGIVIHDNNYIVCMDGPRDYFYVSYSNTLPVETTDVIINNTTYITI